MGSALTNCTRVIEGERVIGKKSKPPAPPDLKPISDAQLKIAQESNELAREFMGISRGQFEWMQKNAGAEFEFSKEQANKMFNLQEKLGNDASERDKDMLGIYKGVAGKQMEGMDQQMGFAAEDRKRWKDVFVPMQDRMISEANAYDTPARREAEASRGMVDIQRQSDAQRENADSRLRGMGIDPSQLRSGSMMNQLAVATAANQAMAGNAGRTAIEDRGRGLRADALSSGLGLPAQSGAGYAGSANSGNTAVNAANSAGQYTNQNAATQGNLIQGGAGLRSQALGQYGALTGSPTQWAGMGGNMYGQSSNAYGNAAGTMTQNYQNKQAQWQAGQEQSQRMFDNVMKVGTMAAGAMVAEGGAITRKHRPVHAVEGTPPKGGFTVERQQLKQPKPTLRQDMAPEKLATKPKLPKPKLNGPSGKDRLLAGMEAADKYTDQMAESEQAPRVAPVAPQQHQFERMPSMSEGGRPRGAMPVRQARDNIPAVLAEGEYVLPADVVRSVGTRALDKMVAKYHRPGA